MDSIQRQREDRRASFCGSRRGVLEADLDPTERRCLRCDETFVAPTRVHRLCRECAALNAKQGEDSVR